MDSGSSGHFLRNNSPQENAQKQDRPLTIKQPDGTRLKSEKKCELKIYSQLPKEAREAYTFKKLTFPLISVAKLCDSDCMVIFAKKMAYIIKNGKVISKAPRDKVTKLWTTNLNKDQNDCNEKHEKDLIMNVTIPEEAESNIEKLTLFLYAALGRPNKTTLIKAIKKATWQHGQA